MAAQGKQALRKSTVSEIIDKYFSAYMSNDRSAIEEILSDDFTFTSPYDDHIDKAGYFEKCWHFSENDPDFRFVKLIEDGNEAFVLYECTLQGGDKFRNTGFSGWKETRSGKLRFTLGLFLRGESFDLHFSF